MGSRQDDVAKIELLEGGDGERSEVEVVSRRRDPRWFAVVAVVLLAVVVVAVSSRTDDDRESTPPPESSTSPTVSQPADGAQLDVPETTGAYVTGSAAEALAADSGTLVVLGSADRSWRVLDPSTGWLEELPALAGVDPELVTATSEGLLVADEQFGMPALLRLRRPGPDVAEPMRRVPLSLATTDQLSQFVGVLGAGDEVPPTRVWAISAASGTQDPRFRASLVTLEGERLLGPFDLAAPPRAANAVGLVVSAGGRSFLVSAGGTADLGVGNVVAGAGNYAGRVACDEALSCVQEILDVTTGQVVAGSPFPSDAAARFIVTMAQAPDGSIASLPAQVGSHAPLGLPTASLYVTWSDGRGMETTVDNPRSAPVWLPGGNKFLILTGLGLVGVDEADGALRATRIPGLNVQDATALFVLRAGND